MEEPDPLASVSGLLADINAGKHGSSRHLRGKCRDKVTAMQWGKRCQAPNRKIARAQDRARTFNSTRAVRPSDEIHIDPGKSAKKKSRGGRKKWLNIGMLSVSWTPSDKNYRSTEKSRVMGRIHSASHTYVSRIRGSVAHRYVTLQAAELKKLPR